MHLKASPVPFRDSLVKLQVWLWALVILLAATPSAKAALIFYEPFDTTTYPVEGANLGNNASGYFTLGNNAGLGSSVLTTNAALSYSGLSTSNNSRGLLRIANSTGVNRQAGRTVTAVTTGTCYASFLLNQTTATTSNRCLFTLSANQSSTPNPGAMVWVNAAGQLQISKNSTVIAPGTTTGALSTNASLVVLRYTYVAGITNDEVALWLNPSAASFEAAEGLLPAPDLAITAGIDITTIIGAYCVQGQIGGAGAVYGSGSGVYGMDELRVGTTWADVTPQAGCFTAGILNSPVAQTNYLGQTATFSVTASGSPLTNQWQADGGSGFTNIPGATGASYTTSPLALADNGLQFQVIVGAACELGITVTSAPAILTVIDGTGFSFRSIGSGAWTNLATWEQSDDDGTNWFSPATLIPTAAHGNILVRAGHLVTVTTPTTADELTIAATGEVDASGATLTLANGSAPIDGQVNGTLRVTSVANSAFTVGSAGLQFNDGGKFQWSGNAAPTIPAATWADGSTCLIDNTASAAVNCTGVSGQSFYDFTVNYPAVGFRTRLGITGTATTIRRNFAITIPDVASASVTLTTNTGTVLTIGGNFTIATGGSAITTKVLTRALNAESCNIKIAGNFSVTGYIDYFSTTAGGVSGFEFNGVGSQAVTLDPAHLIPANSNNVSYLIANNSTVVLGSGIPGSSTFTVGTNATLNIGTNLVRGAAAGSFSINPGATVIGNGTNQLTAGFGTINYGGTVNLGTLPTFVGGETFVVFGGTAYTGAFTLSPSTPGIGLTWNTTALNTTGTLGVSAGGGNAAGYIASATVSGTDLILAISAGSPSTAFSVITSADLTVARSSWAVQGGGTFDGSGNATYTNALGAGPLFYSISVP